MSFTTKEIEEINIRFADAEPQALLKYLMPLMQGTIALSSSLSIEDQVLADMMLEIDPHVRIFTLDTGRLFPETYRLIDDTNHHYNIKMEVYSPRTDAIEQFVRTYGINPFYEGIDKRRACCQVRKLEPLSRALAGLDAWVCGLRRSQSVTRNDMQLLEWDESHGLLKVNPLIDWTEEMVWQYIKEHKVPYNELHDRGFPSIGCEPCTRAIRRIDDIRAGRWWWENPEHRECGLHRR